MMNENVIGNNPDIVTNLNNQLSDVTGRMRSQESRIQNLQNELSSSNASMKRMRIEMEEVKKRAADDMREKEKQLQAVEESASQMRIVIDHQKKRISELTSSTSGISSPSQSISIPSPTIIPPSIIPNDDVTKRYEIVSTILTDALEYVDSMERESEKLSQKLASNKLFDQLRTNSHSMQSCTDKLSQKISEPAHLPMLKEMKSLASQVGGSALNAAKLCVLLSCIFEYRIQLRKRIRKK